MVVFINEHDVQIAAVAQLLAAQLAVGNDGELRRVAVAVFQVLPAPVGGDGKHGFGQCAQVVGHELDTQCAFQIARQGAEHLGVVGAAQQVQAGFFVLFAGALQGGAALVQLLGKYRGVEALVQQRFTAQFVDHAGVLQQVAGGPLGRAQQAQQALMHGGALQQQREITFTPQQRLNPAKQAQGGFFADAAFEQPLRGALNQQRQPGAGVFAQHTDARVLVPLTQALAQLGRPVGGRLLKQVFKLLGRGGRR